jgi:hypothetical protein
MEQVLMEQHITDYLEHQILLYGEHWMIFITGMYVHSSLGYQSTLIFTTASTSKVFFTLFFLYATTLPVTHAYSGGSGSEEVITYCWKAVSGFRLWQIHCK